MSGSNLILTVDVSNDTFQKTFSKLSPEVIKEAKKILGELFLLDVTKPPRKLHFHPLKSKMVPSRLDPKVKVKVYTIHITSDDAFKASFTLEEGTAYMRVCGEHDKVDDNP